MAEIIEIQAVFDPLADLSTEYLSLYHELKQNVDSFAQNEEELTWLTPMCYLRYLRARAWNVQKAETMIKATLMWRRDEKIPLLDRNSVIKVLNLKSSYRNGVDKLGRPLIYIKPVYNDNPVDYRMNAFIYILEEAILSMNEKVGVEKVCLVMDFEAEGKLPKRSPDGTTVAKRTVSLFSNHYPERLGQALVLNPPWYIRMLWPVVSVIMDSKTSEKFHLISGNPQYLNSELLKYIDIDQLEQCYGGTKPIGPETDLRAKSMGIEIENEPLE